ncbi:hypothetical protein BC834DRAFT_909778, partial [Gloeopeniophorella convolvens]
MSTALARSPHQCTIIGRLRFSTTGCHLYHPTGAGAHTFRVPWVVCETTCVRPPWLLS